MIESIHTKEDLADRKTPPTIIVIFGASGDLTARKLVPAIFNLSKDNLLPNKCFLIGYGRSSMSDEVFKDELKLALKSFSRREIDELQWNQLEKNIFFMLVHTMI